MALMKFDQLMMGQVRNISRLAAGIVMVRRRWEEMMGNGMIQLINLAAHSAFHFIKNNALKLRLVIFI